MALGKYASLGQADREGQFQPMIVEPFVPPPATHRRGPSGPRPLPSVFQPPALTLSRQSSVSDGLYRQGLVESPRSAGVASLRSHPSHESLSAQTTASGHKSPAVVSFQEHLALPRHRPPGLDPNLLYAESAKTTASLTTGTSDESLPLFTPGRPSPKRQGSVATQLPTVSIPATELDIPWTIGGRGFLSHFEPIPIKPLIIHTILCAAAFPFMYVLCLAASGNSLFLVRAVVGAVSGIVGLTIGYNLIKLSRRGIEATLWATVIHESMRPDGGVTLDQLNDIVANPSSPWAAIRLLFRRSFQHKGARRTQRRTYDRKPWTLCIIIFLFVAVLSACIVFIFGRIVDIYTKQERQLNKYIETTVIGDLSVEDTTRAAVLTKEAYAHFNFTWSLAPFSSAGLIPTGRSFSINRLELNPQATHNVTDTVYVAETYSDQLIPRGLGFGTFDDAHTANMSNIESLAVESKGQVVRWPKWGIRVGCQTLDNLERYLTPVSAVNNMTYLYVPKAALYSVFSSMDIPYPLIRAANFSALMEAGDQPPAGISEADTAVTSKWWQNGVAHSFRSMPLTNGSDGLGWLQIEIILTRLNRAYAPNGTFSVYAAADQAYLSSPVGYDVAVCVEEFKPYVVDAYNSTAGSPMTLSLLHRGLDFDQTINTPQKSTIQDGLQWGINSTGKFDAFVAAHENSRNIMVKDNGRDFYYVPNPTLLSFTDGTGPLGYTKLDANRVAAALAKSDAQHLLPYLAGSLPIAARSYPDKTVAYVRISKLWLGLSLLMMLILGFIVATFVPRLPLGLPRRDFGVYSWLAAIEGDAIVGLPSGIGRYEQLEELQRRGKQVKVRYAAPNEQDWTLPETERAHKEFFERHYTERSS